MKEYMVGEVFRHTDGKVYQCVEDEHCEGCAFEFNSDGCSPYCCSVTRVDGRSVKFIAVTEPSEGMLFRTENGRMYRLTEDSQCACDTDPSLSCDVLDQTVFGGRLSLVLAALGSGGRRCHVPGRTSELLEGR